MFGAPGMLWWAAAAAVPVAIFLFARQRFRRTDWAAMDFLLRAFVKQRRRLRVENLLLLLLRCAALVLLALAWADPRLEGARILGGGDVRREVVLVVDDSFSMGWREASGETPFRRAQDQAARLVRALRAERGDSATLIVAGRPARTVLRRDNNLTRVASELEKLEISDAAGDLADALVHAGAALEGAAQGAEVFLFTDLQRSEFAARAAPGVRAGGHEPRAEGEIDASSAIAARVSDLKAAGASFTVVAAPAQDPENLAVIDLAMTGKFAGAGQSTRFTATVKNFGRRPAGGAVNFFVDGAETRADAQNVEMIPPGATQAVDFRYVFAEAGPHHVEARFVADSLETDNRRALSVRVQDRVRTLLVDGAPSPQPEDEESYFLRIALELGAGPSRPSFFETRTVTEVGFARENLADYDLVALLNVQLVSPARVRELEDFVARGGGLLIFLGDRVRPSEFNEAFWKDGAGLSPARVGDPIGEAGSRDVAFDITPADVDAPPFDYFRDERVRAMLEGVPIYRFFDLAPAPEDASTRVLARFQSRRATLAAPKPAVLEKTTGVGRTILVGTGADRDWNDFGVFPTYVPFVKEMAYHLVRRAAARENLLVGDSYRRALDRPIREATLSRGGRQVEVLRPVAADGETFEIRVDRLAKAGVYRLDYVEPGESGRAPEPSTLLAVNVDPAESDLARLAPERLTAAFPPDAVRVTDSAEADDATADAGGGDDLWRWALGLVLAVLLAESFLAQWFARGGRGAA
ncbi:MAG TPA: BatA domain-containing protein [Planctomycetota bacterium]|nr:BatA domain-containing protein [Planctomycetota bacterium]